jgi:predicted nucleotidyltransferase
LGAILIVVAHPLNPALEAKLGEFRRLLCEHFGPRLVDLLLFGSQARGEAGPDSDIDVAVVLDRIESHAERVCPMQLASDIEPLLLPIVLSAAELEHLRRREDALAESLDRDGIGLLSKSA